MRRLYQFRCGYCGVRESDVGSELTIDHYQPRSHGGPDDAENRVYCCHACNEFKGHYWNPDSPRRILHPLRDRSASHLAENPDGTLTALTDTGAFHIEWLHLNRRLLVEYRRERRLLEAARQAEVHLLERLTELNRRIDDIIEEIPSLRSGEGTA